MEVEKIGFTIEHLEANRWTMHWYSRTYKSTLTEYLDTPEAAEKIGRFFLLKAKQMRLKESELNNGQHR